jgi:hypothetical protein
LPPKSEGSSDENPSDQSWHQHRHTRRSKFSSRPGDAERWVKSRETQPRPRRKRGPFAARLTVDVAPDLRGRIKLEIGLAKGKKLHDKRQAEKDRDWQREKQRLMKIK